MNNPRSGPPPGGPREGYGRGPGGRSSYRSDEEYRESIREVFGNDYVRTILNPQTDYNDYIKRVKKFVERRATQITPSQLRNIFGRVRTAKRPQDLFELRPKLAYVAGRSDKEEMRELVVLLDDLIQEVSQERAGSVPAFRSFFEAIIAYHKYYNPNSKES